MTELKLSKNTPSGVQDSLTLRQVHHKIWYIALRHYQTRILQGKPGELCSIYRF